MQSHPNIDDVVHGYGYELARSHRFHRRLPVHSNPLQHEHNWNRFSHETERFRGSKIHRQYGKKICLVAYPAPCGDWIQAFSCRKRNITQHIERSHDVDDINAISMHNVLREIGGIYKNKAISSNSEIQRGLTPKKAHNLTYSLGKTLFRWVGKNRTGGCTTTEVANCRSGFT